MCSVPLPCACLTIFMVKGARAGGELLWGKDIVGTRRGRGVCSSLSLFQLAYLDRIWGNQLIA